MKQSAELLQQRIPTDAECALVEIEEALMISSFSENLQEMKADVLFMVRVHVLMLLNFSQIIVKAYM